VACSLGNTAAHRGMAGTARHGLDRMHRLVTASTLLGVSLAFTTGALVVTRALGFDSLAPEVVAVTVANLAAAAFRFSILRTWVFRPRFGTHLEPVGLAGAGARPATPEATSTPTAPTSTPAPTAPTSTPQRMSR